MKPSPKSQNNLIQILCVIGVEIARPVVFCESNQRIPVTNEHNLIDNFLGRSIESCLANRNSKVRINQQEINSSAFKEAQLQMSC